MYGYMYVSVYTLSTILSINILTLKQRPTEINETLETINSVVLLHISDLVLIKNKNVYKILYKIS